MDCLHKNRQSGFRHRIICSNRNIDWYISIATEINIMFTKDINQEPRLFTTKNQGTKTAPLRNTKI